MLKWRKERNARSSNSNVVSDGQFVIVRMLLSANIGVLEILPVKLFSPKLINMRLSISLKVAE